MGNNREDTDVLAEWVIAASVFTIGVCHMMAAPYGR